MLSFTPSQTGEATESETEESVDEQDMWHATDDTAESEARIGLREATKKLQQATTSRRSYTKDDHAGEGVQPNRSRSNEELKKVTICTPCGALGHWEDECPQEGTPSGRSRGSGGFREQSSARKRSPIGKGKGSGKG